MNGIVHNKRRLAMSCDIWLNVYAQTVIGAVSQLFNGWNFFLWFFYFLVLALLTFSHDSSPLLKPHSNT